MVLYRAGGADRYLTEESYPVDYSRYPGGRFTMWYGDLLRGEPGHAWRPSIHMPRWASRILLEVVSVRVERLQEITEDDAVREGVTPFRANPEGDCWTDGKHRTAFNYLWNEINGWSPNSFDSNPWVWRVEFRRVEVPA